MDRIITVWICLLFFSTTARGQSNYWEEIPGPYGGFGTMAKTGTGQLYNIINSGAKVYRSDDAGLSWEPVFEGGIPTFTFSIGNTGVFYRKNVINWQKSLNEGADWEQMPVASNAMANLAETADNTFVGHGSGYFFISQDGGNSWIQTSDLPLADNRSVDRLDVTPYGGVVASTFGSNSAPKIFYRSTDGGQNWQRIEIPALSSTLFVAPTGTIFMSTASGGLHRSTDMGLTFVQVANGPNAGGNYMQALPSGRLLAIAGGKLFASDDDGITWQAMNVSLGSWWGMQQIPALGDGSIFSTALESLFKSTDGGQSWHFAAAGIRRVGGLLLGNRCDGI